MIKEVIKNEEFLMKYSQMMDKEIQVRLEAEKDTFENPCIYTNPYKYSPLTAVVVFHLEQAYKVKVNVKGEEDGDDIIKYVDEAKNHRLPIIGLYPDCNNEVVLQLLNEKDEVVKENKIYIQTEKLPETLADVVQVEKYCGDSAYELILVSGKSTFYPMAFDHKGKVRWYLALRTAGYGLFPLTNSRLILPERNVFVPTEEKPHTTHMYEIDFLGRFYCLYRVEKGYHHDVVEKTPGGNLLALSNSIDNSVEDTVVELDRVTGEVIKTLDLRDIFGQTYVDRANWIHLNTVSYNATTDTILLSARNLHSGVKIHWSSNELMWILCNPEFWKKTEFIDKVLKPKGEISWHYQQHTVYEVKEDIDNNPDTIHVILFDNHWHKRRRVKFFDGNMETSFVSLYHINEKEMTVEQGHRYEGAKSKITSNSILEYTKRRAFFMGGCLDPLIDGKKGMIYEYDYDSENILNQYSLKYYFYRAHEMKYSLESLNSPVKVEGKSIKGVIRKPLRVSFLQNFLRFQKKQKVPTIALTEEQPVSFDIRDTELKMFSQDHSVENVVFWGNKYKYEFDLSNTQQTEDIFRNLRYYIPISLEDMKPDNYQIFIKYEGVEYNTLQGVNIL